MLLFFPKKMKTIFRYAKLLSLTVILLYNIVPAIAQTKPSPQSTQRKDFYLLLKQANLNFIFPAGFREIAAINNEDFSFDFALKEPQHNCEVWMMVRSQKENWVSYERTQNDKKTELANPDSMYVELGKAYATALTGDQSYLIRNMPAEVLAQYNADAGKSYLLNLLDLPITHHYKYALILSLQKNHTGTLIAVYFTNDKDPDFYRDVNRASHCLKFKPQPQG
jgi:hypothetical protein